MWLTVISITDYHSGNGSLFIEEMKTTHLANLFVDSGIELGYMKVDYNADYQLGNNYVEFKIYN